MKPITKEEIIIRIKNRFPEENFEVIEYTSMGKKGKVKCCQCGNIIEITKFSNFFASSKAYGCVNCHGLHIKREQQLNLLREHYDIIKTYVHNTHTHYIVKCKKCGHIRNTSLKNLMAHLECGCVTQTLRGRTPEEFINQVNLNSSTGVYELVSEYKNQTTKVLLKHKDCGFIWSVRPGDVIHGRAQCPQCMRKWSKGVIYIKNILIENNIPFEMEKPLNNSQQRFDFYMEKGNLKIVIEFNGRQHYEEVPFFKQTLEHQQQLDKIKQEYCNDNNIILYTIPYSYSEDEVKQQVQEIINKFNDYPIEE